MTRQEYIAVLQKAKHDLDALWQPLAKATNDYIAANPTETERKGAANDINELTQLADYFALNGAWLYDRVNGFQGFTGSNTYSKSMAKKIRKALGFTY